MFNSDKDIDHIGSGLVDRTLPKKEWTHAAHFAAAFWLLAHNDYDPFLEMPDIIRGYNEATGVANTESEGYHETITLASLRAARAFFETYKGDATLYEVVNGFLNSEYGRSDWILRHWSKELLFTPLARRVWVEPDLQALPF